MLRRIKTVTSILLCLMLLLSQFVFALDEIEVDTKTDEATNEVEVEALEEEPEASINDIPEQLKKAKTETAEKKADETKAEKTEESAKDAADDTKEESAPVFNGEAKVDGVVVAVKAAEGVFPEGAALKVSKVPAKDSASVDEAVDKAREAGEKVVSSYSFDIKVVDANGAELQPDKDVEVSFKLDEASDSNLSANVYHLEEDNGLKAEALYAESKGELISAKTDGFSYYTVEFTYNEIQYVMEGDSTVALADILKKIGLEGEVTEVKVSNDKLFSAEKTNGEWMVTAHRAFTSKEWMKVTIGGIEYEIVVTDAQEIVHTTKETVRNTTRDGEDHVYTNEGLTDISRDCNFVFKNGTITTDVTSNEQSGFILLKRMNNNFTMENATVNMAAKSRFLSVFNGNTVNFTKTQIIGDNGDWNNLSIINNGTGTMNFNDGTVIKAFKNTELINVGTINFNGTASVESFTGNFNSQNASAKWVVNSGELTIKDSEIKLNVPITVKSGATLVIDNSTIDAAGCTNSSAIKVEEGGTLIIKNKSKVQNFDNKNNSAIEAANATVEVSDSTFTNNIGGENGGAIRATGCTVTIGDDTQFDNNTAKFGGAVYLEDCAGAKIGKATFKENGTKFPDDSWDTAIITHDGGALYIKNGSAEIAGTVFEENLAATSVNSSGGAAYIYGANVEIKGAKFRNNTALIYGGALTVAHNARVSIEDLDGDPTEFTDNLVQYGTDFAGGGLFINNAYVKMMDAAIYGNAAEDAGGGIGTCTTGTAQVRVRDGAAIFDNDILAGDHEGGVGFFPPVDDIMDYKDIFFQTRDHKDADTGEIIPGRDGFPTYDYELYERMFNGGIHNWKAKPISTENDEGKNLNSFVAQSNPNNTDVSGAKVVFTGNQAWRHPNTNMYKNPVSGGAIGCNGLLEIGTSTEIKIVKLWDDKNDKAGARPTKEEFLETVKVLGDGTEVDLSTCYVDVITEDVDKYVLYNNVVSADGEPVDFEGKDAWLIIISGLEKYSDADGTAEIEYTVEENGLIGSYALIRNDGDMDTHFEIENKAKLIDIPVEKIWDDDDDHSGLRPKSITVELLANGEKVDEIKLSEENDWQGVFKDMLECDADGNNIEYSVSEVIEGNLKYYKEPIYQGDAITGFIVTNEIAATEDEDMDEVEEDKDKKDEGEKEKEKEEEIRGARTQTGDNAMSIVSLAIISIAAGVVTVAILRRRNGGR